MDNLEPLPLISVITVAYNAEDTIGITLKSVGEQSYHDFEYLVIDGASKDKTVNLVQNAHIPNCRIVSEHDNGLYDAMNKALRLAKGKYLLFLNAGDSFFDKNTLEDYAKEASLGADIIYGDTIIVNAEGEKISPRHLSVPKTLTKKSFANGMLICHQAFMVRKALVTLYDLSYRFSADYDWCINCIKAADSDKCINLDKTTIKYLSDGLTDNNKVSSLLERFKIMRRHYGLPTTLLKHLSFIPRFLKRH